MEVIDNLHIENRFENPSSSPSFFSEEESIKTNEVASDFFFNEEDDDKILFIGIDDKKTERKLKSFNSFVEKRKDYLESLKDLEDWISGTSETPSSEAIECSKHILDSFKNWISAEVDKNVTIPNIIMGPMPRGGITVELRPDANNGMFINIFNNDDIEIEVMVDDYFYSVDKMISKAEPYILGAYERIINE